jgi:hypothetical protein
MQIAIKHYLLLKRIFAKAYFLDEPTSRDFAVLAFIAGDKVTTSLLEKREARSIDTALDDLANPNQPEKTWFARAVYRTRNQVQG